MDLFGKNFSLLITYLNKHKVDYLLIGGYAVVIHGYNRFTADMDILFKATNDNGKNLLSALEDFGYETNEFLQLDFSKDLCLRVGEQPDVIDILNKTVGIDYEKVFDRGNWMSINGLMVKVIHINDLIENKKALNTFKDLADAEQLIKIKEKSGL